MTIIQNGRSAILGDEDVADLTYLAQTFGLSSEDEARELAAFLQRNL